MRSDDSEQGVPTVQAYDPAQVPLGKKPHIYLDFCFYAYCNFTCTYCRDTNEDMSKGSGREAFDQAVSDFLESNVAAVFKVSGYGESTLWPDLPDAIARWADRFPCVQLISNGAGPGPVYQRLAEFPNFQACITLDGHTPELDRFRTKGNVRLHGRVLKTIDALVDAGVKVELNCVVTQANAGRLGEYFDWVHQSWPGSVMVIPFPVRPTLGRKMSDIEDELSPTGEHVDMVEEAVVDRYSQYCEVLPSPLYLSRMIEFMRVSDRRSRCHIHHANFGVNTDLKALACACAGDRLIEPLGPISAVGKDAEIERRQLDFLRTGNVGEKCATCFTHYDLVNLYLDGSISDTEISRVPSLSFPGAIATLRAVREDVTRCLPDGPVPASSVPLSIVPGRGAH